MGDAHVRDRFDHHRLNQLANDPQLFEELLADMRKSPATRQRFPRPFLPVVIERICVRMSSRETKDREAQDFASLRAWGDSMLVEDHGERRSLARVAASSGWSVRELEAKARAANERHTPRKRVSRPARDLHPDQEDAIERIGESLGEVLGRELRVAPAARGGGYRVELTFNSVEEALDLARRLASRSR